MATETDTKVEPKAETKVVPGAETKVPASAINEDLYIGDTPAAPTRDTPPVNAAASAVNAFMQGADPMAVQAAPSAVAAAVDPTSAPPTGPRANVTVPPEPDTEQALQNAIDALDTSPELTYQQRLKKLGISQAQANTVIDNLMNKGVHHGTYKLTSKTNVVFRSRGVEDQELVQKAIERERPQFNGTVSLIMAKYNLATSLASLGNQKFDISSEGTPAQALKFIEKLPYPIFDALLQKLVRFDQVVMTVMDEGALENF